MLPLVQLFMFLHFVLPIHLHLTFDCDILQSDVTLKGYRDHKVSKSAENPLTMQEEELLEVKQVLSSEGDHKYNF